MKKYLLSQITYLRYALEDAQMALERDDSSVPNHLRDVKMSMTLLWDEISDYGGI